MSLVTGGLPYLLANAARFTFTPPRVTTAAVHQPLYPVSRQLFVTNVASWLALGPSRQSAVTDLLKTRTAALRKLVKTAASSSFMAGLPARANPSQKAITTTAALVPGQAGQTGLTSYPPFSEVVTDNSERAAVAGEQPIGPFQVPCADYGYADNSDPLMACGGFVTNMNTGDANDGTAISIAMAGGAVATGWALAPLVTTYYAPDEPAAISASFTITTLSFSIGGGVGGTCSETNDWLQAIDGNSGAAFSSGYTPSPQVNLTSCISTAQVEVPLPTVQAVESLRSFIFNQASEVLASFDQQTGSPCADLSAGLGVGSYLSSVAGILFTSGLPAINVNANCSTQTIGWSSSDQLPANAPVGFQVGAEANARAIAGVELSAAASKVTGSAWADCGTAANCEPQPSTSPPSAATSVPGGTPASFSGNYDDVTSVQADGQEFSSFSISVPPTGANGSFTGQFTLAYDPLGEVPGASGTISGRATYNGFTENIEFSGQATSGQSITLSFSGTITPLGISLSGTLTVNGQSQPAVLLSG